MSASISSSLVLNGSPRFSHAKEPHLIRNSLFRHEWFFVVLSCVHLLPVWIGVMVFMLTQSFIFVCEELKNCVELSVWWNNMESV